MSRLVIAPATVIRLSLWLAAALTLVGTQSGCVQRRITVRSNPPGALVYIDDVAVGTTPCSTYFTYYGKRKIRLVKDGFETLTTEQMFWPPWYEVFPLDFVTENFYPGELRDERNLVFNLAPQRLVPIDQLLERGENLRRGTQSQLMSAPVAPVAAPLRPAQAPLPAAAVPPTTMLPAGS